MGDKDVLVVDDDPLVRRSLQLGLEELGYSARTAENGHAALSEVRQVLPDAVLLDIFMPGKDGIETLRQLKREYPGLRIIMMSGGGKTHHLEILCGVLKLGADFVVQKPVRVRQLADLIEQAQSLAANDSDRRGGANRRRTRRA